MLQPANGVKPRRQYKADIFGSYILNRAAALFYQRLQPNVFRCFHLFKPVLNQCAVFAPQRHNVGHRAQSHKLGVGVPQRLIRKAHFIKRLAQLKSHAHAGKMLKRVIAVFLMRIYQRISLRQNLRRRMVVSYHNIKRFWRACNFLYRADAAVHRYNKRRPGFRQMVQRVNIQPVAFAFALRYVSVNICSAVF